MEEYETVVTYRDDIDGKNLARIDRKELIVGLKAIGILPVAVLRYPSFLAVSFVEEELQLQIKQIQIATSGEGDGPLIPYGKIVQAERWWRDILATFKPRR